MRQRWTVEWQNQFGQWEPVEAFVLFRSARRYLARRVVGPLSVRSWRVWDAERNRCALYVVRQDPSTAEEASK